MKRVIRTAVFDLDGTLVRTEAIAAEMLEAALARRGTKLSPEDRNVAVGRTWASAVDRLIPRYLTEADKQTFTVEVLDSYRDRISKGVEEVPGAVRCVRALAAEMPIALVSGSSREEIEIILHGLGILDCFQFGMRNGMEIFC